MEKNEKLKILEKLIAARAGRLSNESGPVKSECESLAVEIFETVQRMGGIVPGEVASFRTFADDLREVMTKEQADQIAANIKDVTEKLKSIKNELTPPPEFRKIADDSEVGTAPSKALVFQADDREQLTELERYMILDAVKTDGTYNPAEIMFHFEESLTQDAYKKIYDFLKWVDNHKKKFGRANIESVYAEYLENPYLEINLDDIEDYIEIDTIFCSDCETRFWVNDNFELEILKETRKCPWCEAGEDSLTITLD